MRSASESGNLPPVAPLAPLVSATAPEATPQALQRQFALASQISARLGEISAALQQANELQKQIAERTKDAAGKNGILSALEQLEKDTEVASEPGLDDDFMLFGMALPKEDHEALPGVAAALTRLLLVLESADGAPTADVATSAAKWDAAGEESLAHWKQLLATDRMRVNTLLQKSNLKPLVLE